MKQCRTFFTFFTFFALFAGAGMLLGTTAYAQDVSACPEDEAINNLRSQRPTALDSGIVDGWISKVVRGFSQRIAGLDEPTEAINQFAECFHAQYANPENVDAFKALFAKQCGTAFLAEFQKAKQVPLARAISRVLLDMKAPLTREALLAGLAFPDQATRYRSAKGLASIIPDVSADARLTKVTLQAISQAGAAEESDIVAEVIYQATLYPEHAEEAVAAMLTMLDGRLTKLRAVGKQVSRAELEPTRFFDSLSLNNPQKAEVVKRMTPLLRIATLRYGAEGVEAAEKAALQETIDEVENLIRKLTNPTNAPSISEKMQKGGDSAAIDMQIELNRWIGTEQDEGVLNRAPWSVPRGAP